MTDDTVITEKKLTCMIQKAKKVEKPSGKFLKFWNFSFQLNDHQNF